MKKFVFSSVLLCALLMSSAAQAGQVFALDLRATPNRLLSFPSNAPANNSVASVTVDSFAMDFDGAGTTLYAVTPGAAPFSVGTLSTVDGSYVSNGAVTGLQAGENPTGLKFDPQTNQFWLSVNGALGNRLYTLDVNSGAATFVSTMSGLAAGAIVIDIAVDISGQMYGHDIASDTLVTIDKNTGVAATIGGTGQLANFAQGMDFDYDTNELFATVYTGGGTGVYARFNLATGLAEVITSTTTWNSEMEMAINSPVPEPTSLVLIGLGAALFVRRR